MAKNERRRRRWGESKARAVLGELARSGESEAAFARRRGVGRQRLRYGESASRSRSSPRRSSPSSFPWQQRPARLAANALTRLTTCRKMGVDPRSYLREALAKILAGEKKLVELLPATFARAIAAERAAREAAAVAA